MTDNGFQPGINTTICFSCGKIDVPCKCATSTFQVTEVSQKYGTVTLSGIKADIEVRPELNLMIATKVFGWKTLGHESSMAYRHYYAYSPGGSFRPVPNYSGDISAAWEVVEKFAYPKAHFEISTCKDQDISGAYWKARIIFFDDKRAWISADASSAPHAICLAALKAVGVDV